MFHKNTSTILSVFLCILLAFAILPIPANADMGPKPSLNIQFENMGEELCYGTILTQYQGINMTNGLAEFDDPRFEFVIKEEFENYADPDNYNFLGYIWEVSESPIMHWGYLPPNSFKILLYYPETKTFASSGIMEKKDFHSYYTVDMQGADIQTVTFNDELSQDQDAVYENQISAIRKQNIQQEILSFIARVLCTILIETIVALLFGFREKKQILLLTVVNIATQVVLNLLLNEAYYYGYPLYGLFEIYVIAYIFFELIVFALEAVIYCLSMNRLSIKKRKKTYYVFYAFFANFISFGSGVMLVQILPGMF